MSYTPQQAYQAQLTNARALLQRQQQRRRALGRARLAVFLLTVAAAYYCFTNYGLPGFAPTIGGLAALLFLVSKDVANNAALRNTTTLLRINEEELEALQHRFAHRDEGNRFFQPEHAYAADLDVFGPSSIYQWLTRCYTASGAAKLAEGLREPLPPTAVLARHAAVKEMAPQLPWRQQWQAYAAHSNMAAQTETRLKTWLADGEEPFAHSSAKWLVAGYCAFTLVTATMALAGLIPGGFFSMLYTLFLVVSLLLSRRTIKPAAQLGGVVKETATLPLLLHWLEAPPVQSAHLQGLQQALKSNGRSAGNEVKELKRLLDRFDLRGTILGVLLLNPFLLWDVQQLLQLNSWRRRNKSELEGWFGAVAEMEVLHSLSTVHFNHPHWAFPEIETTHFTLDAAKAGHPLLPEGQRVHNDFYLEGKGKIGLVTGSNMAGKSTFLRTLGVNAVLAQMGAPVCATHFRLSPVRLLSSMRIADNLAENTSTFYAELKKLRTIIEQVKAHQPVFVLLDEMLRGTNSFDRHKGAAAVIKQLIREEAVAVIATHDVELAALENSFPQAIANYHFDVQVEGEELYFDYKLKRGVCHSLNASLLMKKIGIDMQE